MKKQISTWLIILFVIVINSCKDKEEANPTVYGCTDPTSTNYNSAATVDDGSCQYPVHGCMDPISISYNPLATVDDSSCLYGGTGGNVTVVARPEHHGVPVFGPAGYPDSAFIKFNTQNFPGNSVSDYDTVIAGQVGANLVSIPGLKPGKYYIMMAGYDTTINDRVIGGIPFIIIQTGGQYDLTVPVTE